MIIGITGTLASGKGTIANTLVKKGFKHFSVRDFLIGEIIKRNLVVNRDNMVLIANDLRAKNSPSYIVERLYEMAKNNEGDCIIESLRAVGEVEALRKKEDFILIAVEANPKTRYERAILRGSQTDKISFEEFLEQEQREMNSSNPNEQNLAKCIEIADVRIENEGSFEELEKKVEEFLIGGVQAKEPKIKRREDYLSWNDYFMSIAILSGKRSKDPNTQVGACIVNSDKRIIGIGYNGFPKGCSDEDFPWEREGSFLETKYAYVCHAELNAILNSFGRDLKNATIYVQLFPCNECVKAIIQTGIKKIVYLSNKYEGTDSVTASKRMLDSSGVKYEQLISEEKNVSLILEVEK